MALDRGNGARSGAAGGCRLLVSSVVRYPYAQASRTRKSRAHTPPQRAHPPATTSFGPNAARFSPNGVRSRIDPGSGLLDVDRQETGGACDCRTVCDMAMTCSTPLCGPRAHATHDGVMERCELEARATSGCFHPG